MTGIKPNGMIVPCASQIGIILSQPQHIPGVSQRYHLSKAEPHNVVTDSKSQRIPEKVM
jgi:hypothetical protein